MAAITSVHEPADLIDSLLRTVHHPCYLVGHGRRPLAVSNAFCELSGYRAEQFLNLPMSTPLTPPSDYASTSRALDDALAGKPPVRLQRELIRRDGSLIPVQSTGRLLPLRGSSPIVLVEFWPRQRVEGDSPPTEDSGVPPPSVVDLGRDLALADLLDALLRSLTHACFVLSQAHELTMFTDALCDLSGYDRATLATFEGTELPFAPPDEHPGIRQAIQAALSGAPPRRRSRGLERAGGERIPIEASASLMPMSSGSPLVLVEFWPVDDAGETTGAA